MRREEGRGDGKEKRREEEKEREGGTAGMKTLSQQQQQQQTRPYKLISKQISIQKQIMTPSHPQSDETRNQECRHQAEEDVVP
ncbi:hypothetical protein Baya_2849 [Bagarius yarrelli]|uniref:Uncharacterized protein n=1 Tax=Bagarius yarrelli TaxID=175774 RepID=A0A556TQS0_BAGYA|nr:hypothetical protein Baya_2849 [Bagarius yarrelli]